jgi:hypothetical protein
VDIERNNTDGCRDASINGPAGSRRTPAKITKLASPHTAAMPLAASVLHPLLFKIGAISGASSVALGTLVQNGN